MDKTQKPKFLTDKLEPCIDITENEILQIKIILLEYISVEELFAKVNPKLKTSYLTRKETFADMEFENDNFLKIPREKMNLEERMLLAFFTLSNLKNDLNELLEYMNKMYEIIRYGNEELVDRVEEDLAIMVIRNALTNHFSAKIKILIPDADEDDDKPYEPSAPK